MGESMTDTAQQTPPTKQYFVRYVMYFILYTLVFGALYMLLHALGFVPDTRPELRIGSEPASASIPFFAAIQAVQKFLKVERRIPAKDEASTFIWGSLLIAFIMELVLFSLSFAVEGTETATHQIALVGPKFAMVVLALIVFKLILNFFLMKWCFGGLSRFMLAKIIEKEAAKAQ